MNQSEQRHARERGAVRIQTLLTFVAIGIVVLILVKIAPVYTEQRQIIFDVDELANKCAVRNMKADDVKKAIVDLAAKYALPEGSLNLVAHDQNKAHIALSYKKTIDFIVTNYDWKVDHTALGKAF